MLLSIVYIFISILYEHFFDVNLLKEMSFVSNDILFVDFLLLLIGLITCSDTDYFRTLSNVLKLLTGNLFRFTFDNPAIMSDNLKTSFV